MLEYEKYFHFISGLPRSGTTLLSSILKQNPQIRAGMSTDVANVITLLQNHEHARDSFPTNDKAHKNYYRGILNGYYREYYDQQKYFFDTSFEWVGKINLLRNIGLNVNFKVICCMRDIPSIINSFMVHSQVKTLKRPTYLPDANFTYEEQIHYIFENIIVRKYSQCLYAYQVPSLREKIIFLDYDDFISNPEKTINRIYTECEIEPFDGHMYGKIDAGEYQSHDESVGNSGMHLVNGFVGPTFTPKVVPNWVYEKYNLDCFWRKND